MEIKKVTNPANKVMQERSSIRKYDSSVKISKEELSAILQDALTAPSSFNLQPWRFVVIDSKEGKELIKPYMMFNQLQWETSSAIIAVFADLDNVSTSNHIYSAAVDHDLMDQKTKEQMVDIISSYSSNFTKERITNSAMLDCGFVIMQLMLSAKNHGYDTNPIGGFMKKELSEALGMDAKRYAPALLVSIGKADEKSHSSIRYSVDEITQWK